MSSLIASRARGVHGTFFVFFGSSSVMVPERFRELWWIVLWCLCLLISSQPIQAQWDPHWVQGRSGIVQLFEWKWRDIAEECENFLAPYGYAGVQISPPTENAVISWRPWWERYQPLSYHLVTRSGDEHDLANMIRRCSNVGVRVYADVVLNHMTRSSDFLTGTGGHTAQPNFKNFPAVPYGAGDFNGAGRTIYNYNNPIEVRECELEGLKDLKQSKAYVRGKIAELLNKLIDLGVAGFRVDSAKYMWPGDLHAIYRLLKPLNTRFGFQVGSKPFFAQEIIDLGGEAVKRDEYLYVGRVTEFRHAVSLCGLFRDYGTSLNHMVQWGENWGLVDGSKAVVFVDSHDSQRGHGLNGQDVLTHKEPRKYRMATAFMLAWPYGVPRIMSSYSFTDIDEGPPKDRKGNIASPDIHFDDSCGGGWVCEHRWRQIYNMIEFRNLVHGSSVQHWWDNGNSQVGYCRGDRGFIAFNNEQFRMNENLQTCLPAGSYCDVISGFKSGDWCTGKTVVVARDGRANIVIDPGDEDGVVAIHRNSKL